jgi:nucleotide-binding universal stress UspA family protein
MFKYEYRRHRVISEILSARELEDLRDEIISSRDKKHRQEKIYQLYARGPLAIKYLNEVMDILMEDDVLNSCNDFIKKLESLCKKFNKILVSIDGSKESLDAADYGISLAKLFNAVVTVIHVLPQEIRYGHDSVDAIQPDIPSTPVKGIVELSKHEVQAKLLNKIMEKAKEMDVNLQTDIIVATRSVASEIVDYADKLDADLIIAGTRGRSGLKRILLGSVASEILRYADCPVLIVK